MSAAALSPPTNLTHRFALFIACVMRTVDEAVGWRGAERPLAMLLWDYLAGVRRRLTALHERFAAGKLPAAPRARRPVAERAAIDRPRPERRPPAIPPGPVLLTAFRAGYCEMLQALLDDPEMRALLAASPQAGRILRPLWRKLTPDPLPPVLRLPPRPRRPRPPKPRQPRAKAAGPPGLRAVVSPNGFIQWEPTPCFPALGKPPRPKPAAAAEPPALAPALPAARPPDRGRPDPPAEPRRPLPHWLPLLFQR